MATSLFDLFRIGVGPSSSHTVGPMRAACDFVGKLSETHAIDDVARFRIELFGSLALTGKGHGTDVGILLGLMGEEPQNVDPAAIHARIRQVLDRGELIAAGNHKVRFSAGDDLILRAETLPGHPNAIRFTALGPDGDPIDRGVYYSIGGGFIRREGAPPDARSRREVKYRFHSAEELLRLGEENRLRIFEIAFANELAWRTPAQIRAGIERIWETMRACVLRGLETEGVLPGGLGVRRRAPALYRKLLSADGSDPLIGMDWLSAFAMAVTEENAAGGRVVTAPTNGAAGVIPAVTCYYERFYGGDADGIQRFFLGAAAVGSLYKENASISGAEVGCQGEVGVASSMAAAGLVSALNGTNAQVEHAAEIAMEHHLGMTCDPVRGLVQIPCIERNAFGAVKAVNAARMAMQESGPHKVSLDQVIRTMYQTGLDMRTHYKETSLAGLAVNAIEC